MDVLKVTQDGDLLIVRGITPAAREYLEEKYQNVAIIGEPFNLTLVKDLTTWELATNKEFIRLQSQEYDEEEEEDPNFVQKEQILQVNPMTKRNVLISKIALFKNSLFKFIHSNYPNLTVENAEALLDNVTLEHKGNSLVVRYPAIFDEIISKHKDKFM